MSDYSLGIDLIAGLNETQSKTEIDAAIKRLSTKLDQLKVKLDVDDKALQTIKTFNTEMKKLSQAAEKAGQSLDQAMKPSGSDDIRVDKTKRLIDETQKLDKTTKKQSQSAQAENKKEAKTLDQLKAGYTELNRVVKEYDEFGKPKRTQHNLANKHGDISRVVTTDGKGDVTGYRDVEALEKNNKRLQKLAQERENVQRKIAEINQKYGDTANRGLMNIFSSRAAEGNIESLGRMTNRLDRYSQSLQRANNLQVQQRQAMQNVQHLESSIVGRISPEHTTALRNYLDGINSLTASTPNLQNRLQNLQKDFTGLRHEVIKADQGMARFSGQALSAMARIPIYAAGVAAMYAPLRMFRSAIEQIIEIDTQMTVLERVTDGAENMNTAMTASIDIAERLGNTIAEVNEGLINFARQGYRGDDLTAITEVATVMANVSDLNVEDAASSLTAAMKGFNIEAQDSIRIVDSLNEVDRHNCPLYQQWCKQTLNMLETRLTALSSSLFKKLNKHLKILRTWWQSAEINLSL